MKRYTGQKALYEAISRSRAKTRRGNILERFLPDSIRPENAVPPEGEQPPDEPAPAEVTVPVPVATEPPKPVAPMAEKEKEKPREPVIIREPARLRRLTPAEKIEVPPEKPVIAAAKPRPIEKIDRPAPSPGPVQTWWRLKPVQLNAGRIEISVPYHIGVVAVLVVLLVVLVAYRIGQKHPGQRAKSPVAAAAPAQAAKQSTVAPETAAAKSSPSTASSPAREAAQPAGDHLIVLKYSTQKQELDNAKDFFAKNKINATVMSVATLRERLAQNHWKANGLPKGDGYLLILNEFYGNPDNPATDGHAMRQKIIDTGKEYKPAAPTFFKDAYGIKVSEMTQQEKQ